MVGELGGQDALHGGDLLCCRNAIPREVWASGNLAVPPHLRARRRLIGVAAARECLRAPALGPPSQLPVALSAGGSGRYSSPSSPSRHRSPAAAALSRRFADIGLSAGRSRGRRTWPGGCVSAVTPPRA